jgi:hypothetical protein
VSLPFHEFGHLFFGMFGETIGVWGGTLMQLAIPFGILGYFSCRGRLQVSFSARSGPARIFSTSRHMWIMPAPLHSRWSEGGEHDGNIILGQLRILRHDHYIAATAGVWGWFIMVSLIMWFLAMGIKKTGDG